MENSNSEKGVDSISAEFSRETGCLMLCNINCLLCETLTRTLFLDCALPFLLYRDKDFFDKYNFFHFAVPVVLWGYSFRLTVHFSGRAANSFCCSYGLSSFCGASETGDEAKGVCFENMLVSALGFLPSESEYHDAKVWRLKWGGVRLGSVIQNEPELKIGIGWFVG